MANFCHLLKIMSKFSKFINHVTSNTNKLFEKIGNKFEDFKNYLSDNKDKTIMELLGNEANTPLEKDLKELGKELSGNLKENIKDTAEYVGIIPEQQQGGIIDTTGQNEEIPIGENFNLDAYKELRNEAWAREDEIRQETQAREDTAWQRSIEDLRKSGANINLMNAQPAASGGGITSATGIDTSAGELELEKYLTELEGILDRELKADESAKDRISDLISSIIFAGAMLLK